MPFPFRNQPLAPLIVKLTKIAFFIAYIVLFANCEKVDSIEEIKKEQEEPKEPDPQEPEEPKQDSTITYFTLNRASAFSDDENWLVVHNQDGELLDYKRFERGDSLVFKALKSELENTEKLSITHFRYSLGGVNHIHIIKTYTEIDKEAVWDQQAVSSKGSSGKIEMGNAFLRPKLVQELSQKNAANYNIVVNNVPGIERYTLTSKEHYSVTARQIPQYNTTTLNINEVDLVLNVEYLLSIEDAEGEMKYRFLNAPETSGDIVLDYVDFLEYDHVLNVELPEHDHLIAEVSGYDDEVFVGSPLLLSRQASGGPEDQIARLGYIDDYKEYDTFFTIRTLDHYGYGFEELGKIPDTIVVMEKPSFTFEDTSVENFNFVTEVNYLRRFSFWDFKETLPDNSINQTQWHVNAKDDNKAKMGFLPEEIIEKYPNLNFDKLSHLRTDLVLKGRTYEDVINSVSNQISVWPPVYEWVTFYNPEE